jgi:hypothetical protein
MQFTLNWTCFFQTICTKRYPKNASLDPGLMPVQPGMQFHWANQWGLTGQTNEHPLDTCLIRLFAQ